MTNDRLAESVDELTKQVGDIRVTAARIEEQLAGLVDAKREIHDDQLRTQAMLDRLQAELSQHQKDAAGNEARLSESLRRLWWVAGGAVSLALGALGTWINTAIGRGHS